MASTYLSKVIPHLLPATQTSSGRYGRIRQVKSAGRVGRGVIGGEEAEADNLKAEEAALGVVK